MNGMLTLLSELDRLYCADTLEAYELEWQKVAQQIAQSFPGFTIGYAEIATAGKERTQQGNMAHVLVPTKSLP